MKSFNYVSLLATTVLGINIANATVPVELYKLKGDPLVGSRIPTVDAVSPIPFNKSYSELSSEHQTLLKSQYDNSYQDFQPPFPVKGLHAVYEPIVDKSKKLNQSVHLSLNVMVDRNGNVDSVKVVDASNQDMAKAAIKSVKRVKFESATCDGVVCEMAFPVEFRLN